MSFKVIIGGVEVIASTPADAIALAQELARAPNKPRPGSFVEKVQLDLLKRSEQQEETAEENEFDPLRTTYDFLLAIRDSGDSGADSERIQKTLLAAQPKGIGVRARHVNNILRDLGFEQGQVYTHPKNPKGRRWKAGPKLLDAVQAVEGRMMKERRPI